MERTASTQPLLKSNMHKCIKRKGKALHTLLVAFLALLLTIDDYLFCEGDEDIRPYFYGSIAFGLIITLFTYTAIQ